MNMNDDVMNMKELMAWLRISRPTVERMMKKGLPRMKIGRQYRFDKAEVKGWMKDEKEIFG